MDSQYQTPRVYSSMSDLIIYLDGLSLSLCAISQSSSRSAQSFGSQILRTVLLILLQQYIYLFKTIKLPQTVSVLHEPVLPLQLGQAWLITTMSNAIAHCSRIYRIQQFPNCAGSNWMKTACAFHPGHVITHFCKHSTCLLPLCNECVPIHKQEHNSLPDPIQLSPIEAVVAEVHHAMAAQFRQVDCITIQTLSRFRESEDQHKRLLQDIIVHKDTLVKSIHSIYDNILTELQNNGRRRDSWLRQFNQVVLELKQEIGSLIGSLKGEKYLRSVIMWNRMKPEQLVEQIARKAEKKWVVPSFVGCNPDNFVHLVASHTNLKVLEIEGDSGVRKILNTIRVLRYGQPDSLTSTEKSIRATNSPDLQKQQSQLSQGTSSHSASSMITSQSKQQVKQNILPVHSPSNKNLQLQANQNQQLFFSSPGRRASSKKLEVLSSLEGHKSTHTNNSSSINSNNSNNSNNNINSNGNNNSK